MNTGKTVSSIGFAVALIAGMASLAPLASAAPLSATVPSKAMGTCGYVNDVNPDEHYIEVSRVSCKHGGSVQPYIYYYKNDNDPRRYKLTGNKISKGSTKLNLYSRYIWINAGVTEYN